MAVDSVASGRVRTSVKPLNRRGFVPGRILAPQLFLIILVIAGLLFGLVMVFSASAIVGLTEQGDSFYYFKRQLLMVMAGLIGLVIAAVIDYRVWKSQLSWIAWGVLVFFLLMILLFGNKENGSTRWIDIFGFNFQPSEFAKIACMLLVASLIVQLHQCVDTAWNAFIVKGGLAVGVPVILIMMQPDLGTLMIAVIGILAVAWFGELPRRAVLIGLLLIVAAGAFSILGESFRQDRVASFLDPWADPLGSGYQIINSYYAFGDGGIFGVGLGMSRQKLYLPEAQNDFVFAIIGEELGLLGALAVVVFFIAFVRVAFRIGANAPDLFGRTIACSAATLIGAQAFLNILCVIGFAPITGKPLPFFSYGGTSMIATLILVGLILSVSLHSDVPSEAELRRDELRIISGRSPASASRPTRPLRPGASAAPLGGMSRATSGKGGSRGRHTTEGPARPPRSGRLPSPAQGAPAASSAYARTGRTSRTGSLASASPRKENPALRLSPARNQRPAERTAR